MNQKEQITDTFNNVNNLKGIVLKKKKNSQTQKAK